MCKYEVKASTNADNIIVVSFNDQTIIIERDTVLQLVDSINKGIKMMRDVFYSSFFSKDFEVDGFSITKNIRQEDYRSISVKFVYIESSVGFFDNISVELSDEITTFVFDNVNEINTFCFDLGVEFANL